MLVKFKYRVFYSEENDFSICKYRDIENDRTVTCKGTSLPIVKSLTYDFTVNEVNHPKYGVSYDVISYEEVIEKTEVGIVEYLSCGLFLGITKTTAQKIYDMFGQDTLNVLDTDINKLINVPGIGKKTLAKVKRSYIEKRASRDLAKELLQYGVTPTAINRVYCKFKGESIDVINTKPYELSRIRGISFYIADRIAKDHGFPEVSLERFVAASDYVILNDMSNGNVCMPKLDYANEMIKTLNCPSVNKSNILDITMKLITLGFVKYNKRQFNDHIEEYFYLPSAYNAERDIANNIRNLLAAKKKKVDNIDNLIDKYTVGINLDESQRKAVELGVTEPIFIITGGPGTGKTTILKVIAKINEELKGKNNNVFLSPTGRAARRITESTGYPAKTIHSALNLDIIEDEYIGDTEGKRECAIENSSVIVDEASMIDLWTMNSLLKNLSNSTLGIIGDADQLPSVRCGSVLRDLIECGLVPCVQLTHIHRQSTDALNICENALAIKTGTFNLKAGEDFELYNASSLKEAEDIVVKVALGEIEKYGLDNVKVLCPFKKYECGVYRVNNILQNKLNPLDERKELKIPNGMTIRVGDPVMQLKNIEDVSNGDIGYITMLTEDTVTVRYNGFTAVDVDYSYIDAKEQLILAYATTVHKSQGSEYDSVILALTPQHGVMKKRNILYTGITRGKHKVTFVGTKQSLFESIKNNMIESRHSMLAELIASGKAPTGPKSEATAEIVALPTEEEQYTQLSLPLAT